MIAELWIHRPCVHGHEGSFRTHPPVAEILRGDELPCEGGRPRARLNPEKVMPISVVRSREKGNLGIRSLTVQDVIDALEES